MLYIILISTFLALLGAFLILTAFEMKSGTRILSRVRAALDTKAARASFIMRHVDWSAFLRHSVRNSVEYVAHELAHGTLILVRFIERLLTRSVRALRARRAGVAIPTETGERPTLRETLRRFRRSIKPRHSEPEQETN